MQFVRSNKNGAAYVPFGQEMVKFIPGVNAIAAGVLKKLTGGFRGTGKPKGGPAAPYFTGARPEMQLVPEPIPGDPVHKVKVTVGVTKSRRRLRLEAKADRDDQLLEELRASREAQAELTRQLIALSSGNAAAKAKPVLDPGAHSIPVLETKLDGLTAAQLIDVLRSESDNKNRSGAIDAITDAIKITS